MRTLDIAHTRIHTNSMQFTLPLHLLKIKKINIRKKCTLGIYVPSEGRVVGVVEGQCRQPTGGHCSYSGGHSREPEHPQGHSSGPDEPMIRPFPSRERQQQHNFVSRSCKPSIQSIMHVP